MAAKLAEAMSLAYGIHPQTAKHIGNAVELHDIGKAKIPGYIINKPGKLSPSEFEIMKTHTTHGESMLAGLNGDFGEIARKISLYHHEQYNGKGYWGKFTSDLPPYVQIASICDVYCALVSPRVYKHAWTNQDALEYIRRKSGEKFCPVLAKVFLTLMDK
jgi:HD-GYP domain-containing protein (c-di-GMP phosphodiesterase class II)